MLFMFCFCLCFCQVLTLIVGGLLMGTKFSISVLSNIMLVYLGMNIFYICFSEIEAMSDLFPDPLAALYALKRSYSYSFKRGCWTEEIGVPIADLILVLPLICCLAGDFYIPIADYIRFFSPTSTPVMSLSYVITLFSLCSYLGWI